MTENGTNYNSVVLFCAILLPERFRNNYTTCLSAAIDCTDEKVSASGIYF